MCAIPSAFSYGTRILSIPLARSRASFQPAGASTTGINDLLDCFAAARARAFHLTVFFRARLSSSFTTVRALITGMIPCTPSSTPFSITVSKRSPFGSAWNRYRSDGSSSALLSMSRIRAVTRSFRISSISHKYSTGSSFRPLLSSTCSPLFMRRTLPMWFTSLPEILQIPFSISIFAGSMKKRCI